MDLSFFCGARHFCHVDANPVTQPTPHNLSSNPMTQKNNNNMMRNGVVLRRHCGWSTTTTTTTRTNPWSFHSCLGNHSCRRQQQQQRCKSSLHAQQRQTNHARRVLGIRPSQLNLTRDELRNAYSRLPNNAIPT